MAAKGVDVTALKELRDRVASSNDDAFKVKLLSELAARYIRHVKQLTPVDSGQLRKGWSMQNTELDGSRAITITNPTEYAEYVEYGHLQEPGRYVPKLGKRLKKSWVKGRFFKTRTDQYMEQITPGVIKKRLDEHMAEVFR